jgi:hypothetical protein
MDSQDKRQLDEALVTVSRIIEATPDANIPSLIGDGVLQSLIEAIAKPKQDKNQTIY